jgi:hypothetical protein
MTMPMPNDGLKGLAPVEPQKLAGIMPNAQHSHRGLFRVGRARTALYGLSWVPS